MLKEEKDLLLKMVETTDQRTMSLLKEIENDIKKHRLLMYNSMKGVK